MIFSVFPSFSTYFSKITITWLNVFKLFTDNFKKHGPVSSKNNRDDWNRRRHDSVDRDREKDVRLYDPMEILRERTMESDKYRDNRYFKIITNLYL